MRPNGQVLDEDRTLAACGVQPGTTLVHCRERRTNRRPPKKPDNAAEELKLSVVVGDSTLLGVLRGVRKGDTTEELAMRVWKEFGKDPSKCSLWTGLQPVGDGHRQVGRELQASRRRGGTACLTYAGSGMYKLFGQSGKNLKLRTAPAQQQRSTT
jgi:hypothetical protein